MIDDRIKLLSERINKEHLPPARLQREMAALIAEMVAESSAPRYVYHPYDMPTASIDEAVRKHIDRLEAERAHLRAYAEEKGYEDIVSIIDGPLIG